jgi:hypothetical protein
MRLFRLKSQRPRIASPGIRNSSFVSPMPMRSCRCGGNWLGCVLGTYLVYASGFCD